MQCPRCRHENRPQAKFCEECAASLARTCPQCGSQLSATAKFCSECAHPVDQSALGQQHFTSPQSYTPKHLAEKILTSKSALEGERKQVTVLFADLKGSMELLADRDPEEARKLLDPVLERMMAAVHRYEGTVNQVMGDGIMALFGAPIGHEDHAVRACYAALRMQESVKRYAEGIRREHGITIRIRVGVNSGEVVVRAIGSDLHMDYTAVGQTTHLAARMEQLADPGTILLTTDTLAAAEGFVRVNALGPMALKGLPAPLEVYELVGASAVRSRLQAAAARGFSRFVGRDAEIEQLRRILEHARQGRGQVAAIVGEPGVGKSRLVFELTHSHRVDGWLVLEAGSVSYGKATSYLPVSDLLRAYFRVGDRDTYRDVREKVTGKTLTLDRALEAALPALLSLLDVPVEDPQWAALDPSQRRHRTLEALKRLLLREAQAQPVLLVFEDLHWIDAETQALLDSFIESLPTARVLLLVNYRPEYRHGWGPKTYYGQLRLDPLPPESADELLEGLLGGDPSLRPLKSLLAKSTGGNPLFLEESVRTLVESHAIVGERGAYHLAQAVETVQVPATVQAILAARIDRLPPEEKRLLETAAVIGKDCPFALLQAIAEEPDQTLRARLDDLQAAEFLYETSLYPDLEYTFKHALTHEVAYGSVLSDRRRSLHARIVEAIERLYPDRLAEHVERLAHHGFRGELWERALVFLRQAGTKAVARGALREAVSYLEQAVVALDRLPRSPAMLDEAIDLRLSVRNALYALAEHERTFTHLQAAERLATERGDPSRLARTLRYMSIHFGLVGDYARAMEAGQRAVRAADASGDADLGIETRLGLALVHFMRGEYGEASAAFQALAPGVADEGLPPRFFGIVLRSVMMFGFLGAALAERGEFREATEMAAHALRRAEALEPRYSAIFAAWSVGCAAVRRGDLTQATRVLEPALARCRATDFPIAFPAVASMLGLAYSLADRHPEAIKLLEEGVEQRTATWTQSMPLACLGEGYLLAGRTADAERETARALDLARARGERGVEAWALRLLGEVAGQSDPPAPAAEEHYRAALVLAEELGMRPLVAHCHLGLGKFYRRTSDGVKAQEHLITAATMYREMDMGFYLAQAEAALIERK